MNKKFTLIKPDGKKTLYFCKGKARWERTETKTGRMIFTVESPEHVFKFVLPNPTEEDQKLRAQDVEALHPQYVIFRNGRKISRPDFQLCKTEELPADERKARHAAATTGLLERLLEWLTTTFKGFGKRGRPPKTVKSEQLDRMIYNHWKEDHNIDRGLKYKQFAEDTFSDYGLSHKQMKDLIRRMSTRERREKKKNRATK